MKFTIFSILLLFTIVSIISISPSAFAEVTITTGSVNLSTPGCEETEECYTPSEITVDIGEKIIMTNSDPAGIHTFTSYTLEDDWPTANGIFDSSMLMGENLTFEWTADTAGKIPYFCTLHAWMRGTITVQEVGAEEETMDEEMTEPITTIIIEPDQMMAEIITGDGIANEEMTIDLTLTDLEGNGIEHITYNIKATQDSKILLNEEGHMHKGTITNNHVTSVLSADASDMMPVVVMIESVGFGHDDQYVESTAEIATKQVVPEFGTIAMMILALAIISIVAITSKSKLSIIPKI